MSTGAGAFAAWAHFYASTEIVQLAAAGGHLLSIGYALRYAVGGDMAALKLTGAARVRNDGTPAMSARANAYITTITRAHRHVITGLCLALLTGLAQLTAQLEYLPRSPIFWTKMIALVLLLANGRIIQLAGRSLAATTPIGADAAPHASSRLRFAAMRSLMLWLAMILLGLMLTTVTPDSI